MSIRNKIKIIEKIFGISIIGWNILPEGLMTVDRDKNFRLITHLIRMHK